MIQTLLSPIQRFWESEARGGIILFGFAVAAFILANSPASSGYFELKKMLISLNVGGWSLEKTLASWVKDFLMAFFFLLVGLEIKREIVMGELSNPRQAALTIVAALGGMIVPALIYTALNAGGPGQPGWGVPMATDIAFAIGVLSLLGKRVPLGLKVFLTAFAIVDDLGAVLVIAFFYTSGLNLLALLISLGFFALALLAGRLKVTRLSIYLLIGAFMWYFMLESGVSPTVAAVLLALAVPVTRRVSLPELHSQLDEAARKNPEMLEAAMEHLEKTLVRAQSPLHRLEHALHPWSTYFIMPVFAFFNAGVAVSGEGLGTVGMGAFLGLLLGKPLGVLLLSWLAVRLGLAVLPAGVNWLMILGAGFLGGIGFTMSLFIAALGFADAPALLDQAKLGVLASSVVAAIVGLLAVWWAVRGREGEPNP
ncbi:Na+/H+ antiporter NhaA [Allomeiothermus silvanus DSM 9946]|uniref:Na(+)/H(+) antiporter NhaA n=1 Tax=Allomeiothermus silvanus (strain ATCC 700542 / DSM 9946 / NBRC 106475 / NCIMB 13440 / VI-R2) TaxID=526227 RepID=D7BBF6_ALLS1|nr:Na+/H+ antiporter NhaA [Allomeiothermus silvanus]ADH64418.1 Na+/H+ antiporter NhaA [Allomeiothermus silvanus DSM 9946]